MISQDQLQLNRQTADRLRSVRERISAAAERSGRGADAITLVAVTKYAAPDDGFLDALLTAGCRDFGENRPQKLLDKLARFGANPEIRWHFIGTLQKNKVRKILSKVALIHSIDTLELAEAVHRIAGEENHSPIDVLLEVDISGDTTKHGFEPSEVTDQLGKILALRRLRVRGLMGMGGLDAPLSVVRRQFALLRACRDECRAAFPDEPFDTLSMGMSHDFEIAIEEGASIVRVGSALY